MGAKREKTGIGFKEEIIMGSEKSEKKLFFLFLFLINVWVFPAWASSYHVVEPGDTLWAISRRYQIPLKELLQLNNLTEQSVLRVGQKIKLEEGTEEAIYQVKAGDTLWGISRQFNIPLSSLMKANNLSEKSVLRVGQKIILPTSSSGGETKAAAPSSNVTHTVKKGESLWLISRLYGVDMDSIMKANNLTADSILSIGMKLTIPQVRVASSPAKEESYEVYRVQAGDTLWGISRRYRVSLQDLMKANNLNEKSTLQIGQSIRIPSYLPQTYEKVSSSFLWPVSGRISSPFGTRGGRLHSGIDILAPSGTLIKASRSGVVSFSGWMNGYGRVVIIDHQDGWQTLYAHNSVNLVNKGQRVNQGDAIARVGMTGNATTYHVHFEV
ncbi:MAG TPA: LysM peptidoglycan-binding domain-containing protein, partial [Candidatus Atribacteria bacterium]|nr:LysM peptidoglycan-binding domain-containing protein [Candidatus Atribacteria bacterium]